jgi:hypothetical protein
VLEQLDVPLASQTLVFSKTSFQATRISPRSPRAIYFSDDVYVGWVRDGDVVEISSVDAGQGPIFYTLEQRQTEQPEFVRQHHACLQCHASSMTDGMPGHIVRSVVPGPDGLPVLRAGTHLIDQQSPIAERWGGWYVTGTHGAHRHMGNQVAGNRNRSERRGESAVSPDASGETPSLPASDQLDVEAGANVTSLAGWFDVSAYPSPHSDIVALMVLEHQTRMHNLITQANYQARRALYDQAIIDEMLGRDGDELTPSTKRRIQSAGDKLVRYLLFSNEAKLRGPIRGTSGFARQFAARGPHDRRGRSLRQLDLQTRLMKHPCSYLIYSEAFDGLPAPMKDCVFGRLWKVLASEHAGPDFSHLSAEDRRAILEILTDTKPDFRRVEQSMATRG